MAFGFFFGFATAGGDAFTVGAGFGGDSTAGLGNGVFTTTGVGLDGGSAVVGGSCAAGSDGRTISRPANSLPTKRPAVTTSGIGASQRVSRWARRHDRRSFGSLRCLCFHLSAAGRFRFFCDLGRARFLGVAGASESTLTCSEPPLFLSPPSTRAAIDTLITAIATPIKPTPKSEVVALWGRRKCTKIEPCRTRRCRSMWSLALDTLKVECTRWASTHETFGITPPFLE